MIGGKDNFSNNIASRCIPSFSSAIWQGGDLLMNKSFSSCRRRKDDEINRINFSCVLRNMKRNERKGERECARKGKDNEKGEESERERERERERAKRKRSRRENNFGYMMVDVKEGKREDEKRRKKQSVVVDLLDLF